MKKPKAALRSAFTKPELLLTSTGRPADIASSPVSPKPSVLEGITTRSTFWNKHLKLSRSSTYPLTLKRLAQGPKEMCLSLEHQNPSKTSEKMGYFDGVTVSSHILYTAKQETEGSQDRLTLGLYLEQQRENSLSRYLGYAETNKL